MADHPSLRAYLDSIPQSLLRVPAMSVLHEITALQYALEAQGRRPVVLVERPRLPDGSDSALPVVCNLTASRVLTAAALGIADHRQAARAFAEMTGQPIPPIRVAMQQAPVQQHIERGEAASLERLPALKQHALDPGRYLTASHAITIDPDSGVDNTAIQRGWIKGPRRMSWYPYPGTHNARNLRKWWAQGKPCPVAFWIGHHPAVSIGAQAKLAYDESKEISSVNAPHLFISERCSNFIYAMQEYTAKGGKDEATKDPIDALRYIAVSNPRFYDEADLVDPENRTGVY